MSAILDFPEPTVEAKSSNSTLSIPGNLSPRSWRMMVGGPVFIPVCSVSLECLPDSFSTSFRFPFSALPCLLQNGNISTSSPQDIRRSFACNSLMVKLRNFTSGSVFCSFVFPFIRPSIFSFLFILFSFPSTKVSGSESYPTATQYLMAIGVQASQSNK